MSKTEAWDRYVEWKQHRHNPRKPTVFVLLWRGKLEKIFAKNPLAQEMLDLLKLHDDQNEWELKEIPVTQ